MNTIMSVINGLTVASTQAVIEKRYPATGEVIAEIQPATSAMLDEAEAIARANATEFGLGIGILTQNLSHAHRVADQLQSENIWINSYNLIPPGLPFGESKQSGFGHEGSVYALEINTEVKATYVQL